jgi:hypothetical protein
VPQEQALRIRPIGGGKPMRTSGEYLDRN